MAVRGDKALRNAGLKTGSALVSFDHEPFWKKRLKLFEIETERLGRLIRTRGQKTKRRLSPKVVNYRGRFYVNLDQRLGTILVLGAESVQALVDQYRSFRVVRAFKADLTSSFSPGGEKSKFRKRGKGIEANR
jgi:hypothetical protein